MNISFYTLGCKVNQYETQSLREGFQKAGFTPVSEGILSDVTVINSCTVTAESDRKTRQLLHKIRRENPKGTIVLTGCMVEAYSGAPDDLADADIVIGNTDITKIIDTVKNFAENGERYYEIIKHPRGESFNTPSITDFAERTRAYMKIEDGCERYCSYCVIPFARGFVRSKPLDEIKAEAEALAKKGFCELVLVGINLSAYGKDTSFNLCDAVETLSTVEGVKRIRLGSLEPDHISDEMLSRFAAVEQFCPQFHLSLQSGCDKTLKRMNRHYDTAFYKDLVDRIRKIFPDAAITTDIMVGFAGETEEDFCDSADFLKSIGFSKSHVFAYSRRKGTVAYGLPDQVTNAEKARRSRIMLTAAFECEQAFLHSQIGKTYPVLFESFDGNSCEGYTKNYIRVSAKAPIDLSGKIKDVKIIAVEGDKAIGEIACG